MSARDVFDLARQAEAAGFERVWLNEDIGRDSIPMLTAISTITQSIGVGTAIAGRLRKDQGAHDSTEDKEQGAAEESR